MATASTTLEERGHELRIGPAGWVSAAARAGRRAPRNPRPLTSRAASPPGTLVVSLSLLLLCSPVTVVADSPPTGQESPARATRPPSLVEAHGRRVLLLFSEPRLTPAIVSVDASIRATLESRSPVPVSFYTEYLDLALFDHEVPLPELRELLRRKYEARPLDLIVAGGSSALRVALRNRATLFSNAPVVFTALDPTAAADLKLDADVTGTWLHQGWAETLELARRLQPGIRRAIVITGSSPPDLAWLAGAREQLSAADAAIEVAYLADRPFQEILDGVTRLPSTAVVLVGPFLRDATGRDFRTADAIRQISAAASVPVYGLTEVAVGTGAAAGYVVSFDAHGRTAAELALRVLAGERPPPVDTGTNVPMFDARQLTRWGLDARRLPPGSVVLFQEPSLWTRYRWLILGVGGALLVQSALIAGLLVQRAQRRRAQEGLAERLRFETLLAELSTLLGSPSSTGSDSPVELALSHLVSALGVEWATARAFGSEATELILTHAESRPDVPPRPSVIREDDMPWVFARVRDGHIVRLAGPSSLPAAAGADRRSLETRGIRSAVMIPLLRNGAVAGCLSAGTIREEHQWPDDWIPRLRLLAEAFASALERLQTARAALESQEAIRDLAGRLMTAQEEERRSIARDLHDDVNQELAAQSIALSTLGGRLPVEATSELREEVARLQSRTVDLARTIRHLSHSLHPGTLEHAGLVAALRSYCRSFEREHGLSVTFRADGQLPAVPADLSLCLYRVTQEGLGNVARHAEARQARVTVSREGDTIVLTIVDDGRGFDLAEARRRHGLGLISLDERVRLVGGRLTIDSQSQRGTELRIVVPLSEARDAPRDRAAG